MNPAALLEVHMHDPAGWEFGVDAHFVGESIEQINGCPDRKDRLNQNRHKGYSLVPVCVFRSSALFPEILRSRCYRCASP